MFLYDYQLIITAVAGWAAAQVTKTLLYWIVNKEFRAERLIGNGGMPSSHSSTVCSLSTAVLLRCGADSAAFAIAAVFSIIVLTDAMGVRLETGKQAKLLNQIIEENILMFKEKDREKRLKELVGHTPFQVIIGSLMGIGTALIINGLCNMR